MNTMNAPGIWKTGHRELPTVNLCNGVKMNSAHTKPAQKQPRISKAAYKRARKEGRITQY
jgi:hypothetical protein